MMLLHIQQEAYHYRRRSFFQARDFKARCTDRGIVMTFNSLLIKVFSRGRQLRIIWELPSCHLEFRGLGFRVAEDLSSACSRSDPASP